MSNNMLYLNIFLSQMGAIVLLSLATFALLKIEQYHSDIPWF